MKVVDSEKAIALLEKAKKLLPGNNGILPHKYLTGFDHAHGDIAVLIIGRKEADGKIQIVNQFQGKEAEELYERLVEKK